MDYPYWTSMPRSACAAAIITQFALAATWMSSINLEEYQSAGSHCNYAVASIQCCAFWRRGDGFCQAHV